MKQVLAFFIAVFFIGLNVSAKQVASKPDSIKKLLITDIKNPSVYTKNNIDRLNQVAEEYFESSPDSTYRYASLAINLAGKASYIKGMADGYVNMAMVNTFRSDYASSERNFKYALQLNRRINALHGMSDAYLGLGRIKDFLGNYGDAIKYLDSALTIRKKLRNETDIAECYNSIGVVYDNHGKFSKALDYYLKSLAIYLKQKDTLASADNYCNIGIIMQHLELYPKALHYFDIALKIWEKYQDTQGISTIYLNNGEVLMAQKKYQAALANFKKASAIFHQMDDTEGIAFVYYDLGLYHYYNSNPDTAINYFKLALAVSSEHGIKYNKAYAYLGLAMVYNQKKDYKNGYRYAMLAQSTANNLGSENIRADAALQLSKALAGRGSFEQAYQQMQNYTSLKDSVKSNYIIQKITAYNLEYDFNKSQLEYQRLHQAQVLAYKNTIEEQRRAIIIYVVIALLTGTIAIVYYNAKRKQTLINQQLTDKTEEITAQKNNLNTQADKLNDLNHLKDRLIAILAHDLRAPLSTLRGLFGLMADKEVTQQEFAEMIPQVFSKLESTSDFLDTLLFWINSQVDDAGANIKSFCLCTLIDHELNILEDQINQKRIHINNTVTKGQTVLADPNSIRIVVHNFLTNAIKFSPMDGVIDITTALDLADCQRVLTVRDAGQGMSPTKLNSLFKGQVSSTRGTNNEVGTGMGLLFCKELIETYNGRIWAESEEGKGTSLCFSLPVDDGTHNKGTETVV